MRIITKKDEKGTLLITEYKKLAVELNTQIDIVMAEEEKRNKIALQIQKTKDRLIPVEKKLTKGELGEFEVVTNMQIGKELNGIEINVVDAVEEFKEAYRKKKK